VEEFVVEKEEEEEMVIPEEEDDAWMLDIDQDDALLLAAACDSNENLPQAVEPSEKKPRLEKEEGREASSSAAKCFKCGQAGHFSRDCPVGGGQGGKSFATGARSRATGQKTAPLEEEVNIKTQCATSVENKGTGELDAHSERQMPYPGKTGKSRVLTSCDLWC